MTKITPTPKLKAKTVSLLRKIQKHILAEPRRLRMELWGEKYGRAIKCDEIGQELPACRTQACIAGWTVVLGNKKSGARLRVGGFPDVTPVTAQKILGINFEQGTNLFYFRSWLGDGHGWPDELAAAYIAAESAEEKAKIAADRIDHFIQTGGQE